MADSPPEVLLAEVRDDAGPFQHLGSRFTVNGAGWWGAAVASPIAVYLLKKSKVKQGYASIGYHGGLVGGLAGALLSTALEKNQNDFTSTCLAEDLPQAVRAALDPKNKSGSKDVIIIHKATVSLVKGGGWNNAIKISAGTATFSITTNLFRMFARPRAMAAMGWTLNQPLSPTAAPIHDMQIGSGRQKPADKPLWQKILLIAGSIALFLGLIALRIFLNMH